MSAFSMFYMQSSSFLEFQRKMEKETGRNNAKSLFEIDQYETGYPLDPRVDTKWRWRSKTRLISTLIHGTP